MMKNLERKLPKGTRENRSQTEVNQEKSAHISITIIDSQFIFSLALFEIELQRKLFDFSGLNSNLGLLTRFILFSGSILDAIREPSD